MKTTGTLTFYSLIVLCSLVLSGCGDKVLKNKSPWRCALQLDSKQSITAGSQKKLCDAIRRGADLRIYTTFRHNEHLDTTSDNPELVEEVSEFGVTYLVDDRWSAGTMTWRQPVNPSNVSTEFGPPSMSFFLYNQNGDQAIARPFLDGRKATAKLGRSPLDDHSHMPKYHQKDSWDGGTNAPSQNFVYDFGEFRYFIRDDWQQVLSHTADGTVVSGSVDQLAGAFGKGCEIKVAINGLCDDLATQPDKALKNELFVKVGAGYNYTEEKLFIAATHHLVRIAPAAPLVYKSKNWDFGWVTVRTDGLVIRRICNPYTLKFTDTKLNCDIRWFVR